MHLNYILKTKSIPNLLPKFNKMLHKNSQSTDLKSQLMHLLELLMCQLTIPQI